MEKKRINLFSKKNALHKSPFLSSRLQMVVTLAGVAIFLLFIIVSFLSFLQKRQYDELAERKKQHLEFLKTAQNTEVKIQLVGTKQKQLETYLKNDVNFMVFYEKITGLFTDLDSTTSATLEDVSLNKDGEAQFTINTTSLSSLLKLVDLLETSGFTKDFTELTLQNFAVDESKSSPNYKVKLTGTFKQSNL